MRLAIILALALASSPAVACHKYSIWHYPFPQRCPVITVARPLSKKPETFREQVKIPLPVIEFLPCPDADERLVGIAKLRALMDGRQSLQGETHGHVSEVAAAP